MRVTCPLIVLKNSPRERRREEERETVGRIHYNFNFAFTHFGRLRRLAGKMENLRGAVIRLYNHRCAPDSPLRQMHLLGRL